MANQKIVVHALANVIATVHGVNQTYDDPNSADATLYPPEDWAMSEGGQMLLNGLRLSSTLLSGSLWAGEVSGAFNYTGSTRVLDAQIYATGDYEKPVAGVLGPNNVSVDIVVRKYDCTNTPHRFWGTLRVRTDPKDSISTTVDIETYNHEVAKRINDDLQSSIQLGVIMDALDRVASLDKLKKSDLEIVKAGLYRIAERVEKTVRKEVS